MGWRGDTITVTGDFFLVGDQSGGLCYVLGRAGGVTGNFSGLGPIWWTVCS